MVQTMSDKGQELLEYSELSPCFSSQHLKSFPAYAARALQSLKLEIGKDVTEEEISEYEERFQNRTAETAILWTLSVMLCRVVESAIALDRVFFLEEAGLQSVDVVPIFNYKESPRNLMIVASKGEQSHEI